MTSLAEHRQAYASGGVDPLQVAQAFLATGPVGGQLDAFIEVNPDLVLAEAGASSGRLQAGQPRGPLEGVLVGVKDFFDVRGYETRFGTTCITAVPDHDSPVVARLRAAGAVIAGKTRGTELGLSPIGMSVSGGSPRNPHDLRRVPGGSSSGSAVAVASGLTPLAVGSDGGGSLRIPPALTGVYGLKATFGRIRSAGVRRLGWWSLDHPGPIARNVEDLSTCYAIMADRPPPGLEGGDRLRVGVDWSWWGVPDSGVDATCRAAVDGLDLHPVEVEHLELARIAEYVTISAEVAAGTYDEMRDDPAAFGPDVRLVLELADSFTAVDYVRAQQVRTLLSRSFAEAFEQVDVLVTPMTACPAPVVDDAAWGTAFRDEPLLQDLTAYSFPANLTGMPAATVPVGTTGEGAPVGLQILGAAGAEDTILRFAAHLELAGRCGPPRPVTYHDLLAQESPA